MLLPLHPRTRKRIDEFGLAGLLAESGVRVVEPLGYVDTISLLDASRLVLTDSGGMQEETTAAARSVHYGCGRIRSGRLRSTSVASRLATASAHAV